jgi:hypothetical protein
MTFDWQDAIALVAAAAAASYLARRGWLAIKRKRAACGGCGSCPASAGTKTAGTKTILTIDLKR